MEARGQTQSGNGDRSGDLSETSSGDGIGEEDGSGNGNEDGIEEGGGEAKNHKKAHKRCRCPMGNEGYLDEKRKKRRKERVGPVAPNPDNLANNKEAGGGGTSTQGLIKNCTSRKCVSPMSRFKFDRALPVRTTCNVESSIEIANVLWHSKSVA